MLKLLDLAKENAPSICRVVNRYSAPQGTAFMLSSRLLITNNHVIYNCEEAESFLAEFNYEHEGKKLTHVTRFELNPKDFFVSSHFDDLDFTIVSVGEAVFGNRKISEFGNCHISNGAITDKKIGEPIHIIHHPWGEPKKIDLNGKLDGYTDRFLYYTANTCSGSSGCPIFNDEFEVIGIHRREAPKEPINNLNKNTHEGISITAILEYLRTKQKIQKDSDILDL